MKHSIPWLVPVALLAAALGCRGAECRIVASQGRPTLALDGVPVPMSGYSPIFWEKRWVAKHLPNFAPHELGYVFSGLPKMHGTKAFWADGTVTEDPVFMPPNYSGFATIDEGVRMTVDALPGARLIIRFGLDEPETWRDAHPEQCVLTETGERLRVPSLASDLFWGNSAASAAALVRWYEKQPYRDRIVAYADFWRCEGTHESTIMGWLSDRSPVMVAAWRAYLSKTYGGDETRLREAWGDAAATLAGAMPPADRLRGPVREVAALSFWQAGKDNAPLRDWLLCLQGLFHQRVRQVAGAMQQGCQGRVPILHDMLKQPMQGWNIGDFFDTRQPMQPFGLELMGGCGSSGAAALFDAPGVDGLITPHDYQARGMGGIFEPEGAADSCVVRGKLFLCEMDTRSYAGNYRGNDYAMARDLAEFEAVTWRNVATALSRGWWPYWMDLHADWFSDPAMAPVIARQAQVLNAAASWPHHDEPGIAIVIDDAAMQDTNGAGRYPFLAVSEQLRLGIARCGVPYRIYLIEDLALASLPRHRLWYFPNLFRCDERRLALLARVQKDGNVVIWGPGSGISDGIAVGAASATRLTGFAFDLVPGNYQRRGLFRGGHELTAGLAGQPFGDGLGYGPQLYPKDGNSLAMVWAQQGVNRSALSVKAQEGWTSIFAAALPLPAGFWRNAARLAKAHIWCESDDVLVASQEIVALHSIVPGVKIIRLPRLAKVVDLATSETVTERATEIRFELTQPATRVFQLAPCAKP